MKNIKTGSPASQKFVPLLLGSVFLSISGLAAATSSDDMDTSTAAKCAFAPYLACTDQQGSKIWSNPAFSDETTYVEDRDTLYLSQAGRAYAFARNNGEQRWQVRAGSDSLYFFPVLDGDSIYLARTDGKLEKRQANSGKLIWSSKPADGWVYPPLLLNKELSNKKPANTQLLTGGQDGIIWQLEANSGKILGRFTLQQELVAPLILNGNRVIAGTFDGKLSGYQISQNEHDPLLQAKWQAPIGTAVFSMLNAGDNVIASDMGGQISSVDTRTGKINWQASLHRNARYWNTLDLGGQRLLSLSNTGRLSILDLASGKLLNQQQFSGEFSRGPIVQNGTLVVYDIDGVESKAALTALQSSQTPLSMASSPMTLNP